MAFTFQLRHGFQDFFAAGNALRNFFQWSKTLLCLAGNALRNFFQWSKTLLTLGSHIRRSGSSKTCCQVLCYRRAVLVQHFLKTFAHRLMCLSFFLTCFLLLFFVCLFFFLLCPITHYLFRFACEPSGCGVFNHIGQLAAPAHY